MKSTYPMWLKASITPPVRGTFSVPVIWKRWPSTLKATLAVAMIGG
jgi:hypothetical protein